MMLRAFVRRAADVPVADTGRCDAQLDALPGSEIAQHRFRGRRAADVAGADEEHGSLFHRWPKIPAMRGRLKIRGATRRDAAALIAFNSAMALETERKVLMPQVIGAGVRGLLRRPDSGFYTVAELGGVVIAALMITKEWSDWRNGDFWWIQSVYVVPEYRRLGVYRRMYAYLRKLAAHDGAVVGVRVY